MGKENKVIKIVAIVEPILTIVLSIAFFFLFKDNNTISAVTLVVGSYLSINGIVYAFESRKRLELINEVGNSLDQIITPQFREISNTSKILELYRQITDPDLIVYRDLLIENLLKNLEDLSRGKLHIEGDECLSWIQKCFQNSKKTIHGVSTLTHQEWVKDERERRLYLENVNAKKRGVSVNRIFVVTKDLLNNYQYRITLLEHIKDFENVYIVYMHSINEDDILLKNAHHGFLLIDHEFGFIDDHYPGKTTGTIIKEKGYCAIYYRYFETLFSLSKPIKSIIADLYLFWESELTRKYVSIQELEARILSNGLSENSEELFDCITWFEILYYRKKNQYLDYFKLVETCEAVFSPRLIYSALLKAIDGEIND